MVPSPTPIVPIFEDSTTVISQAWSPRLALSPSI
ncbi:MAG: hypothetical protein ACD_54C00241G0001, partial [uncultured bacterium]